MHDALKQDLLALIMEGDRQAATARLDECGAEHGYEYAITEVLSPVLSMLGAKWAAVEDISLAQGYVAGKVAQDAFEKFAAQRACASIVAPVKGRIVIGNIEDDCHVLGRKLVTVFLRLSGWEVYDLGEDVVPSLFVDTALDVGAPIVAASAMMLRTARNIGGLRQEIDTRGLSGRLQLAVGGAVFLNRPELVREVGGDGTAPNAIAVPQLMDQLLARTQAGVVAP